MIAADPQAATQAASNAQFIVTSLLTLGAGGIVTAIATAFLSRRKTKAEAGKTDIEAVSVLTVTTLSLIEPMKAEMARLAAQNAIQAQAIESLQATVSDLQEHVRESQERERGHVRQLAAYRAWAEEASLKLSRAGIQISPPPHDGPQFPPLPPSQRNPAP